MQILLSLRGNFCIDFLSFFLSSNIKKLHMQMFNKSQRGSDQDLNKAIRILRSCMKSPQFWNVPGDLLIDKNGCPSW